MSENHSQVPKDFNFKIKTLNIKIPRPQKKKDKKITYSNKSTTSSDKFGDWGYLNNDKNRRVNDINLLVNGKNSIFDCLMNLNKYDNEQGNMYYNSDKEEQSIEQKIIKAKKEMDNVKENIDKLNKKMIMIKNKLEKIELKKTNIENELQNLISNKETLEEIFNIEIEFIKNETTLNCNNNSTNNFCEIKISKEDIQNININQFVIQIINLINELNNEAKVDKNSYGNYFSKSILEIHNDFINQINSIQDNEKCIPIYISQLSEFALNKLNIKYPLNNIKSLIHYLIKFNIFDEEINKREKFIENEYNIHKSKIDEEMVEITLALIFYEKHKHEILNKTSMIQEEINEKRRLVNENKYIYEKDNDYLNSEVNNLNQEKIKSNYDWAIVDEKRSNKLEKDKINKSFNIHNRKKIKQINLLNNDDINKEKKSEENTDIKIQKNIKNRILDNYINSGINLNENKKRRIRKNKTNYNSISEFSNKINISHTYNFNTNFVDIKPIKKKIELGKKNILVLRNIFHINKPKRRTYNSNINLGEFNTNPNTKNTDKTFLKLNQKTINKVNQNKNKIKNNNININKKILYDLIPKKDNHSIKANNFFNKKLKISNIISDESSLTTYKKSNKNHNRILTSKESSMKANTNIKTYTSSQERNKSNNTSMKNIRKKLNNSNLILNINNNINFNSNVSYRRIKNISNLITDNLNDININLNNLYKNDENKKITEGKKCLITSKNSKEKINKKNYELNNFKERKMESFCYFKFLEGNKAIKKYNPLKVCSTNPEYYDYYESYISIDFNSGCLNISPKISLDKIKSLPPNTKTISIKLKDINSIILEKYTKDIIKIQNIILKYNIKSNNNFSINRILNKKEMNEIKLEQNEKIKAALCNFFPFSFSVKNSNIKVDLIFINFEQFNIWLNNMNSIVQNNIKFTKIRKSSFSKI